MKALIALSLAVCYYFNGVSFAANSSQTSAMHGWSYHGKGITAVIEVSKGAADVGKPPYPADLVDDDVIQGLYVAFYQGNYHHSWINPSKNYNLINRSQFRCLFQGRSRKLLIADFDLDNSKPKEIRSDLRKLNKKLVSQLQALGWGGTQLIQLKWGEFRIANTGCGVVYDPESGSNPSQ